MSRLFLLATILCMGTVSLMATPLSSPPKQKLEVGDTGFAPGTLVTTKDGKKPVEQIKDGDQVLATDPRTRRSGDQTVTNVTARDGIGLVDVLTMGRDRIETNGSSLFWVNTKGWIAAKSLFPGDQLLERDGSFTKVFNVLPNYTGKSKVFDVELEAIYTYYVGKNGILVRASTK